MIICAVTIASSEATFVWINAESSAVTATGKIRLADPYDRGDLERTRELARQLLVEKKTDLVVIRKSSTSGKFGAGHVAFRLEALIALAAPCSIEFTSAQSVAAFAKKNDPHFPDDLKKYQRDAYLVAISKAA